MNLDEMLASRHVTFERMPHPPTYTANRMAQVLHVPGREVAKSVLLRAGNGYVLAVVPATHHINLEEVRMRLGEDDVEMATEEEMERLFPDCERGAMPPFGSLYRIPTLVDETLAADEEIVFEGCNHEESIRMAYRDFEEIEHPTKGRFAHHA